MKNKLFEDLKTEQKKTITDDITYLKALESMLSEWKSENDVQDYQNLQLDTIAQ